MTLEARLFSVMEHPNFIHMRVVADCSSTSSHGSNSLVSPFLHKIILNTVSVTL